MSWREALHVRRSKKLRARLEKLGLLVVILLVIVCLTPMGQQVVDRLYRLSGFQGPVETAPLEIHVIDVGKADAMVLRCEGKTALLDAGTYASGDRVVDYLLRMGVKYLDCVIASHPDSDHTGGVAQVLEELPVGELVIYPWPEEMLQSLEFQNLEEAAVENSVPVRQVLSGDTLTLGGMELQVLGPLKEYEDSNNCSLVLRMDYEGFSALFCGDIESGAELDLVKSGADLDVDLLKVPHHGSASSCSQRFLEAVTPKFAVISVGPDNSRLPREETLSRLEEAGAEIYRTDTDGDLVFSWDGEQLSLWSEYHNTLERIEDP
ncbi:MAG: ComEC/Rec2 family competence protein [Acutalibacter sp.]|jgi:competence protein ComEC